MFVGTRPALPPEMRTRTAAEIRETAQQMPLFTHNASLLQDTFNARFASTTRTSPSRTGAGENGMMTHTSWLFRTPVFRSLPAYLDANFPGETPIFCYGASDGSEPYSMAIALQENLPPARAAQFKIKARDLSDTMVAEAQSGHIFLGGKDFRGYYDYREPHEDAEVGLKKYFEPTSGTEYRMNTQYRAKEPLRKAVEFEYGDITQLDPNDPGFQKPCVVCFRNAWYLLGKSTLSFVDTADNEREREALINRLADAMKPGSLLVVGECEARDHQFFARHGFQPVKDIPDFKTHEGYMVYVRTPSPAGGDTQAKKSA